MYIYLKEKKKNRREVVMEWGEIEKRPINGLTHPPQLTHQRPLLPFATRPLSSPLLLSLPPERLSAPAHPRRRSPSPRARSSSPTSDLRQAGRRTTRVTGGEEQGRRRRRGGARAASPAGLARRAGGSPAGSASRRVASSAAGGTCFPAVVEASTHTTFSPPYPSPLDLRPDYPLVQAPGQILATSRD
jgi:hypothetical protein